MVDLIQTNIEAVPSTSPISNNDGFGQYPNPFTSGTSTRTKSIFGQEKSVVSEAVIRHFQNVIAGIEEKFGRRAAAEGSNMGVANEWAD